MPTSIARSHNGLRKTEESLSKSPLRRPLKTALTPTPVYYRYDLTSRMLAVTLLVDTVHSNSHHAYSFLESSKEGLDTLNADDDYPNF